jgi:GT2 family glycosyltransferase
VPECSGPRPLDSSPSGHAPTVSVLVLNCNGLEHLKICLPTLESQTYPRDQFEIVVVDNGSTDGSLAFLHRSHPRVRTVALGRNRGLGGAYNPVTELCRTDFLAFLNNDTRVESTWLAELVAVATRHSAASVASRILDWSGNRIDFAGGILSFAGHAWQRDAGQPAAASYGEVPLLFACNGSMLVRREAFRDAGGFDPAFFLYFDDVDLGWRLSLLGHTTIFAPSAITYHRLHGTASQSSMIQRLRLYERNALMMIYKNYDNDSLRRVLPTAIALAIARTRTYAPLDPHVLEGGNRVPDWLAVAPQSIAHLIALEDFANALPALAEKRREIQCRRRRSDAELLPLFVDPLYLHEFGHDYHRIAHTLMAEFQIDRWLDPSPRTHAYTTASTPLEVPPAQKGNVTVISTAVPMVSVVIVTRGGPGRLPVCLESLRRQRYPAEQRELIVVDNESPKDPTPTVEKYYPSARVIKSGSHLGLAAANNMGLRAAKGTYVAFLNEDARVDPDWLAELVGVARRRHAACVASQVLAWDGRRVEFAGGTINVEGKSFHVAHRRPASAAAAERPSLFASGVAMLVDRDVLLESRGWDEATCPYSEDVELGWRLWLTGEEVWLAPEALVFHDIHGTSAQATRARLDERNSLRMLYTHLEREHLECVLPAALLLATDRALLQSGLGRTSAAASFATQCSRRLLSYREAIRSVPFRFKLALTTRGMRRHRSLTQNLHQVGVTGVLSAAKSAIDALHAELGTPHLRFDYLIERASSGSALEERDHLVPSPAGAALLGIQEFLASVPELERRRAWLQSRRRRGDLSILKPFNTEWLSPTPAACQKEHNELQHALVEAFALGDIAGTRANRPVHGRQHPAVAQAGMQGYPTGAQRSPTAQTELEQG